MQSSPLSRPFTPLRSKYSPQHPVLKHPQSLFFPHCEKPNFTPIQSNKDNQFFILNPGVRGSIHSRGRELFASLTRPDGF
jgi:hypothetical protein